MKEVTTKRTILTIVVILAALIVAYIAYQKSLQQKQTSSVFAPEATSSQQLKTFQSKNLKFSIKIPTEFGVLEKFGTVEISNPKGKINVNQNGTNFKNLNDYLNDLKLKNHLNMSNLEDLTINNLPAISMMIQEQKTYLFFAKDNYTVYSLSTKNVPLYSALDQIAQSFRYTPN